eukprot:TRINITY_DN47739_c0_g1_i1.p1 TRINITY_DN47739_c0_g1~~TRINITY_DN47739_c0_g1_i1.p1  ORF type:complete len:212 (-),score=5.58 TRINITY_DN47739_c0_g1_i1:83-718(-)
MSSREVSTRPPPLSRQDPFWLLMCRTAQPHRSGSLRPSSTDVAFAEQIVRLMVQILPGSTPGAGVTLSTLTKALQMMPPTCQVNLYRKQFGNMEAVLKQPVMGIWFTVQDSAVVLNPLPDLEVAAAAGFLSNALLEDARAFFGMVRHRRLRALRDSHRTVCTVCGQMYEVSVATKPLCSGVPHRPAFDWSLGEDVDACIVGSAAAAPYFSH